MDSKNLVGGKFIVSTTNPQDVFIPEEWNEEQRMIAQTVQDFILTEIHPNIDELDSHKNPEDNPRLLEKAGELGLLSLSIPEEYGGLDLNFNTGLLFGEATSLGFYFATTIGAHTSIGSLPIVYYGNDAQKAKYLPGIGTGELKTSYCLTEPNAGSDANSGKTRAVLSEDGTHYLLTGQKMWITNGGFADIFIVFAKIGDDKNLTAFIVEKSFGGITLGEEERKMGIKGSSTVQVFFDNTRVPVENLLGERNGGFKIALNILNTGRIKLGAAAVGGAKVALHKSIQYAIERVQFEKSIAEFGAIQHKLGEMASRTFASESAVYRIGRNIDLKYEELKGGDMTLGEARMASIREFVVECSLVKIHGSEVATYVIDEAVQIHGGMGFSQDAGIERGYRDARITRIYEGTNEINRMLAIGELFKKAYKDKDFDMVSPVKKMPFTMLGKIFGNGAGSGPYGNELAIVENLKKAFLFIAGMAGNKYKLGLIDEQELILGLADMLAEAYVCESVWLRVQKIKQNPASDQNLLKVQEAMARVYLYEACQKVLKSGKDVILGFAEGTQKKFLLWSLRKLTTWNDPNPKELRREIARYMVSKGGYTLGGFPFQLPS